MVNVSPRNAIGVSWFATLDEYGLHTGPVARYRRWLERGRSLDLAAGTPVAGNGEYAAPKPGSMLGLVKHSPVHWIGVALRPDYLRRDTYVCGASSCELTESARTRFSVGLELAF